MYLSWTRPRYACKVSPGHLGFYPSIDREWCRLYFLAREASAQGVTLSLTKGTASGHESCFLCPHGNRAILRSSLTKMVSLQRSSDMTLRNARSAVKAGPLKTHNKLVSWLFIFCTILMLSSVIRMWGHWFEISTQLGFYRAAGVLTAVTGAALIVSWWVNTGNE